MSMAHSTSPGSTSIRSTATPAEVRQKLAYVPVGTARRQPQAELRNIAFKVGANKTLTPAKNGRVAGRVRLSDDSEA
jgi:hypothetical protein